MEAHEREMLVARVASGTVRLTVANEFDRPVRVVLLPPSRADRYAAEELYRQTYDEAGLDGCLSEADLLDFLRANRLWGDDAQSELEQLEHDVEEFKVGLVQLVFRTYERKKAKLALGAARDRIAALNDRRHGYDHLTCGGVASMAKTRFLVACSLHHAGGGRVLPPEAFEGNPSAEKCSVVFENAVEAFVAGRLPDAALREAARTEPWRSVWAAGKGCGSVFGVPAADLTEEQLRLSVWTQVYEGVAGHPECPDDEVLDDDDACDGWLILQRRKREGEAKRRKADGAAGKAGADADEVFVLAESPEDARLVDDMNDPGSRAVKRQRLDYLRQRGEVNEADMPDVRLKCQMEMHRMMAASAGGK